MGLFTSLLLFAFSVVMQQQAARSARKRQKKLEQEAKERADAAKGFQISAEGEASLLPIQYGRGILAGVRVYHNTSNTLNIVAPAVGGTLFQNSMNASRSGVKHEFLFVQTAICFGDIQSCQMIMVDGRKYNDPKFNSIIGSKDSLDEGRLMGGHRFHFYPNGGVADPLLVSNFSLTRPFTNVAYATAVYALNRDDYQYSGVPDAKFIVEGLKVASIISSSGALSLSTAKKYSNNPALCLLDYLLDPLYGRGLPLQYIDLASFKYAADVCDKLVLSAVPKEGEYWSAKGGNRDINLYECNLTLSPARSIRDNVETILETMGQAELVWSGGVYKLTLEYPSIYKDYTPVAVNEVIQFDRDLYRAVISSTTPSDLSTAPAYLNNPTYFTKDVVAAYITDDDIIRSGESTISWPSANERYNFCTVRFLNEAKDFVEDSVSWPFKQGSIPGPAVDRGAWDVTSTYGRSDIVTYTGTGGELLTSNNAFNNASVWAKANATISADSIAAPDGTLTADTVNRTAVGNHYLAQNYVTTFHANKTYTFSVWMKSGTMTGNVNVWIKDGAGVSLVVTPKAITTTWTRYSVTGTFGASPAANIGVYIDPVNDTGVAGDTFYVWGASLRELNGYSTKYQSKGNLLYSGAYRNDVTHSIGERVVYSGSQYVLDTETIAGTLPTDLTKWHIISNPPTTLAPSADPSWVPYDDANVYNTYRIEDSGIPLEADFFEAGITDYYHALAKAEQRVRFSRSSTLYKLVVSTRNTNLEPGDFVNVTSSVLNIPGELMRLEEIKADSRGNAELNLSKFDARTLAWNANDNEIVAPRILFDEDTPQCTALSFTTTGLVSSLSSGRLSWTAPQDIRVDSFIVYYTTAAIGSIDSTTVWNEIGATPNNYLEIPSISSATYVLTVVTKMANGRTAPRDNGLGSEWPLLSVGVSQVVIDSLTLAAVAVYKRSATTPATPTGGSFDFSTMTMATKPSGWDVVYDPSPLALYVSQARAEKPAGDIDTTLTWSTPVVFQKAEVHLETSTELLTMPSQTTGKVTTVEGGVDVTSNVGAVYSILSSVGCTVTVDNTATASKGTFTVSAITASKASFIVSVVYKTVTYYITINVLNLIIEYIRDLTQPPVPIENPTYTTGFSTIFAELTATPSYSEGHGHHSTRVYGAVWDGVSALPVFADATLIGDFIGTATTISYPVGTKLRLWTVNFSKDFVESNPKGGTNGIAVNLGLIGSTDLGPLIVTAENLAADSVGATNLQANSIAVGTLAVQNGALTNAMIANLTADKIRTGELQVASEIKMGGNLKLSGAGWIESYSASGYSRLGDYSRMDAGSFKLFRYVPASGITYEYAYLKRSEVGVATNNTSVTLPGYWKTQPKIMVSPFNLSFYNPTYSGQAQSILCQATNIAESSPGSMVWSFLPIATLNLAAASGSSVENKNSGVISSDIYTSAAEFTLANTANATVTVNLLSVRGNGSSQYFYRQVSWRVGYRISGSTGLYAFTTARVVAIGAITSGTVTDNALVTFPSANVWEFYVEYTASDVSASVFGSVAYNYATNTLVQSGTSSVYVSSSTVGTVYTATGVIPMPAFTPSAGYSIYQIDYSWNWSQTSSYDTDSFNRPYGYTSGYLDFPTGTRIDYSYSANFGDRVTSQSGSGTSSDTAVTSYSSTAYTNRVTAESENYYLSIKFSNTRQIITNFTATVYTRQLITNSTTPANTFNFISYTYTLTTSQILATGTLNWTAIGD